MQLANITDDVQLSSLTIKSTKWGLLKFGFQPNSTLPELESSTSNIMTFDHETFKLIFEFSNKEKILENLGTHPIQITLSDNKGLVKQVTINFKLT